MEHREDITRFTAVDRQGDPGFFITFLDAGNALEDIKSVKRVMLAQLELCDGVSLLDVGCGQEMTCGTWRSWLARVVGWSGSTSAAR